MGVPIGPRGDELSSVRLPEAYEQDYAALLAQVAAMPRFRSSELTMFWPKIGARYDGDLLVVGRAVNGWIDRWVPEDGVQLAARATIARATGEGEVNGDQLGWVLDRWKRRDGGYDSSRSQFWETIRRVVTHERPHRVDDWVRHVAWTNLVKVAPSTGGNPDGRLIDAQREHGCRLLSREIDELSPRRVLVLTGRWWFEPFAVALGLGVQWRQGLVEGCADHHGRCWVVAVHPMTRSLRAVAEAVTAAFAAP